VAGAVPYLPCSYLGHLHKLAGDKKERAQAPLTLQTVKNTFY